MVYFEQNTAVKFQKYCLLITKIPKEIFLSGDWEGIPQFHLGSHI